MTVLHLGYFLGVVLILQKTVCGSCCLFYPYCHVSVGRNLVFKHKIDDFCAISLHVNC